MVPQIRGRSRSNSSGVVSEGIFKASGVNLINISALAVAVVFKNNGEVLPVAPSAATVLAATTAARKSERRSLTTDVVAMVKAVLHD